MELVRVAVGGFLAQTAQLGLLRIEVLGAKRVILKERISYADHEELLKCLVLPCAFLRDPISLARVVVRARDGYAAGRRSAKTT